MDYTARHYMRFECCNRTPEETDVAGRIYALLRLALAAMFFAAGAVKLLDPAVFAVTVEAFGIVPEWLIGPVSVVLPLAEIVLAVGLAFDVRGSLAGITLLLVLFIAVLSYAVHLGLDIDCGCYGPSEPEAKAFSSLWSSLYRDAAMLAAVMVLYGYRHFARHRPKRPSGWLAKAETTE